MRFADRLRGDQAFGVRHQIGHRNTGVLQLSRGVEDGLVFDLAGDDVAAGNAAGLGHALERKVVGFGGAGGPDDLLGLGADQFGHLRRACSTDCRACWPNAWELDAGLPKLPLKPRHSTMTWMTRSSTGVVAA